MNARLSTSVLLSALLLVPACATVTRGTKEVFVVESDPPGAAVSIDNGMTCDATPCSFKVKRKGALVVTVSKDGYDPSTHTVNTQVAGGGGAAMAGNVLLGGIIGAGVDASNGAMLDHKPNPLVVTLVETSDALDAAVQVVEDAVEATGAAIEEASADAADTAVTSDTQLVIESEKTVESEIAAIVEEAADAAAEAMPDSEDVTEAVEEAVSESAS